MKTPQHRRYHPVTRILRALAWPFKILGQMWRRGFWAKIGILATALVMLASSSIYGIGLWYIKTNNNQPQINGVSFIPAYAESLGLNPQETMDALINDLGIRHFRLVSYWDQLEPSPGQYNFELLDWQFKKAEAAGATVTLALGLRQPRWPECHWPQWAKDLNGAGGPSVGQWQERLAQFTAVTVDRYKTSPALSSYQLENEFFLKVFSAECTDYNRNRLIDEFNLVKQHDPYHPVILARSNNYGLPLGDPVPDKYSFSVYRRVWDSKTGRYFQYPLPPKWYAFFAGLQQMINKKPSILHELQAEPWPPHGQSITQIDLAEQNKSFNAQRFSELADFAKDTGLNEVYYWGAEYWYYRKVRLHDDSVWQVAQTIFKDGS